MQVTYPMLIPMSTSTRIDRITTIITTGLSSSRTCPGKIKDSGLAVHPTII